MAKRAAEQREPGPKAMERAVLILYRWLTEKKAREAAADAETDVVAAGQ